MGRWSCGNYGRAGRAGLPLALVLVFLMVQESLAGCGDVTPFVPAGASVSGTGCSPGGDLSWMVNCVFTKAGHTCGQINCARRRRIWIDANTEYSGDALAPGPPHPDGGNAGKVDKTANDANIAAHTLVVCTPLPCSIPPPRNCI